MDAMTLHSPKVIPFDVDDDVELQHDEKICEGKVVYIANAKHKILLRTKVTETNADGADVTSTQYIWQHPYSDKLFPDDESAALKDVIVELIKPQIKDHTICKWKINSNFYHKGAVYVGLFRKAKDYQPYRSKIFKLLQKTCKYSLQKQIQITSKINNIKNSIKSKQHHSLIICGYINQSQVEITHDLLPLFYLYVGPLDCHEILLKYKRHKLEILLDNKFKLIKTGLCESKKLLKNTELHNTLDALEKDEKFVQLIKKYQQFTDLTTKLKSDEKSRAASRTDFMKKFYDDSIASTKTKLEKMDAVHELISKTLRAACLLCGSCDYISFRKIKKYHKQTIEGRNLVEIDVKYKSEIETFLMNDDVTYDKINEISTQCGVLYSWIVAQFKYDNYLEDVPEKEEIYEIQERIYDVNQQISVTRSKRNSIRNYKKELCSLKYSMRKVWNKYGYFLYDAYNEQCSKDYLEIVLDRNKNHIECNNGIIENVGVDEEFELKAITVVTKNG